MKFSLPCRAKPAAGGYPGKMRPHFVWGPGEGAVLRQIQITAAISHMDGYETVAIFAANEFSPPVEEQTQVGHSCPTCTALHLRQQSAVQNFVRIAIHTPSPLSCMNELSKNGCQPNTITSPAYKKPSKYRKIRAYHSLRNHKKRS